jgi:hypothetical protein
MSALVETRKFFAAGTSSRIALRRSGPEAYPGFDRYLLLDERRAYHVGNVCDTCEFFFERLEGADDKVSPEEVGERLRRGVDALDDELLRVAGDALPRGQYRAMLIDVIPELVQPGDERDYFSHEQVELWGLDPFRNGAPHDPQTEYYRGGSFSLGGGRQLFEFVVPLVTSDLLDAGTTRGYEERLRAAEHPTAFAISVLDVKQPADWEGDPAVTEHRCLAHYLLDGHHKARAASRLQEPLRLISFLAPGESVATAEEIEQAIDVFGQPVA